MIHVAYNAFKKGYTLYYLVTNKTLLLLALSYHL